MSFAAQRAIDRDLGETTDRGAGPHVASRGGRVRLGQLPPHSDARALREDQHRGDEAFGQRMNDRMPGPPVPVHQRVDDDAERGRVDFTDIVFAAMLCAIMLAAAHGARECVSP
ncbi:MAG: hypothetical protein HOV66_30930 [Streptomycetaceae bacterium]|nr:hypothetical protein [Streptomycetaceae bacterium]